MEEIQQSEILEVAPQVENHEIEANPVEESPQVEVQAHETRQEKNWKELNKVKKELERELRMQREINERLLQMQPPKPLVQEVDELDSISDDDYLSKAKNKKLVAREMEPIRHELESLKKELEQRRQYEFLDKLKKQYSDFDEIVNNETLAILDEQEPELSESIAASKDPYKIGVQAYKYIKALNLAQKAPEIRRSKEVEKKLEKNAKTVQSPQVYDKRPMAQAYQLSESEKSKLWQEMHQYAKGASSVPELR
jgi:hypothetical protein